MATKLETARKVLTNQDIKDFEAMDEVQLRTRLVQANEAMREVHDELEANEEYQQAKADCKHLSEGKRNVNKRQTAVVAYCLFLLNEKGSSISLTPTAASDAAQALANLKALGVTDISIHRGNTGTEG